MKHAIQLIKNFLRCLDFVIARYLLNHLKNYGVDYRLFVGSFNKLEMMLLAIVMGLVLALSIYLDCC